MGTYVSGDIEVKAFPEWIPQGLRLGAGSWQNYDAFGLLFDVRNHAGFLPLAPDRGIPRGMSTELHRELAKNDPNDVFGTSWITWRELSRFDWSTTAAELDERIWQYAVQPDGTELFMSKAGSDSRWQRVAGPGVSPNGRHHPEGTTWRDGNTIWRVGRMNAASVREDPELRSLLFRMEDLAGQHGPDGVRLVVWFR